MYRYSVPVYWEQYSMFSICPLLKQYIIPNILGCRNCMPLTAFFSAGDCTLRTSFCSTKDRTLLYEQNLTTCSIPFCRDLYAIFSILSAENNTLCTRFLSTKNSTPCTVLRQCTAGNRAQYTSNPLS
jgi:hypothetical protein